MKYLIQKTPTKKLKLGIDNMLHRVFGARQAGENWSADGCLHQYSGIRRRINSPFPLIMLCRILEAIQGSFATPG